MAIFRVNKTDDFTIISNHHLNNKNLSLKAKGLLSLMLSLPNDWDYSINGLVAICKENETSIKNALDELKNNGYLKVLKLLPNETQSKKIEYVYDIYEQPLENQVIGFQSLDNQPLGNQALENQGQLNTKEQSTKKLNTKDSKEKYKKEIFDRFWNAYPKKVSKGNAEKWFEKNKPSESLVEQMIKKLELLKKTDNWEKNNGQFIPYPATWLNAKGWEDEVNNSEITESDEEEIARLKAEVERRKANGEWE